MAKDKKPSKKSKRPKTNKWHEALAEACVTMQKRIDHHCSHIPEGYDFDPDTKTDDEIDTVSAAVWNIWAIEEEWILDPDLRQELSAIQVDDE